MDLNEIEMYSSHDPFEIDDELVYDYSFEDICSSFDSLELQFVDGDTEQTVKNLFRYFRKRSIPMDRDSCELIAKNYVTSLEKDIVMNWRYFTGGISLKSFLTTCIIVYYTLDNSFIIVLGLLLQF